jgi:hypothetical protein
VRTGCKTCKQTQVTKVIVTDKILGKYVYRSIHSLHTEVYGVPDRSNHDSTEVAGSSEMKKKKKPECSRCLRSSYDCDGYGIPRRREENVLLPKPYEPSSTEQRVFIHFPRTGVYIQPSSSPCFDTDIERHHLMIFQTRTAPELTGYFDPTVWNRKVLQICHDQAYARHAVVALGALWKAQDVNQTPLNGLSPSLGGNQEARELYAFALREYGKAIHLMRDISHQQDPDRLRNTLISSLLTTCFESYVGNQELALSQTELGVDVLLEWGDECQKAPVDDWTSMKRLEHRSGSSPVRLTTC